MAPGLFWNLYGPIARRLSMAALPLPGLLILVAEGVLFWAKLLPSGSLASAVVALPLLVCSIAIVARWRALGRALIHPARDVAALSVYASLVVGAVAMGVNPLPVTLESYDGFDIPGRMVASQPDSIIPYSSAAYMSAGHTGHELRVIYFGEDWSIASRGPLVPLAILSLFRGFDQQINDPPTAQITTWPVSSDGTFISRALGWLLNGMVVLAVARLLMVLRIEDERYRFALAWLAVAPSLIENTLFLWPKLLSGYFIILSVASVFEGYLSVAGGMMALAWLSHPVGVIFLPGVAGLAVWRTGLRPMPVGALARLIAPCTMIMLPWLIFKAHLGEHDLFVSYLLAAGDAPHRAHGLFRWLMIRCSNLWNTLIPANFYLSIFYHQFYGKLLTDAARWNVQYTTSLPGAMGFALFWIAYGAIARRIQNRELNAFRKFGLVMPFTIMVIGCGYSGFGLGRYAMEPLIPILIAFAAAATPASRRVRAIGLFVVWCESVWVEVSSFATADTFTWSAVPTVSWALWALGAGAPAFTVAWLLWRRPERTRGLGCCRFRYCWRMPRFKWARS